MTRGYTHEKMHDDLHVGSNGMESTRRQTLEVNSLDWKCPMFDPKKRPQKSFMVFHLLSQCKFPCERVPYSFCEGCCEKLGAPDNFKGN